MSNATRMAAWFVAHGSPMLAVEHDDFTAALRREGDALPRPRAIVVVSAHWESRGSIRVTSTARPPLIYDFSGFPPELDDVRYPCAGDPPLAAEIVKLLLDSGLGAMVEPHRGLDHGAWVPLVHAFPKADIPVVEVSLPAPRTSDEVVRMGKALSQLRDRGILLMGTGGLVHNLRLVRMDDKGAPVDGWAKEFDGWVRDRIRTLDLPSLAGYRNRAPHAELAVPTTEHFDPLFFALGAGAAGDRVRDLFEGFHHGNLSMRSLSLAP
jgi:4,5-DOPA dioxygenase extradiol